MSILVIAEKPSVARTIAGAIGANETVYEGKQSCFKGNGYYVAHARGHLYDIGMPQDYGYGKSYKLDELPMFPHRFTLHEKDESTAGLRKLISDLMKLPEIESIVCATDAGREGELIFRNIYNANNCTKPVYRLWSNSMTDESIRQQFENLPKDSDFDGEYRAADARAKADWIFGMNLSRLYSVLDNYTHKVGRVKTPVLNLIVERDKEIENFTKSVSFRLELENGAVSDNVFDTKEKAEEVLNRSRNMTANVISVKTEDKIKNRPLLHSLSTLQQEANRVYGYTLSETLNIAQSLYEKKLTTYPRTDCNYVSEDMKGKIIGIVSSFAEDESYGERARAILGVGLNLDSRVVNNRLMEEHDHHAILPEKCREKEYLTEKEKNVYNLIVNRLLCAVDKPYEYKETVYCISCGNIDYTAKNIEVTEIGWKKYDADPDVPLGHEFNIPDNSFTVKDIKLKEIESQPKKHYTDASLLSVMNNIDKQFDVDDLKEAVKGKGIGTEATRAEIVEELVTNGYVVRKNKNLIATPLGRDFAESLPDNVKSLERTAQWEQSLTNIKDGKLDAEDFLDEVKTFVRSVVEYEKNDDGHRKPLEYANPNLKEREIIGACPRCQKNILEGEKNFYCESGKDGCGFKLWKEDKFGNVTDKLTAADAKKLVSGSTVKLKAKTKDGEPYSAEYRMADTGTFVNLYRVKKEKISLGKCPKCHSDVYEAAGNYYCSAGKDKCNFLIWKEDKHNKISITADNVRSVLDGKDIVKVKKQLNGSSLRTTYRMTVTDKYVNFEEVK